MWSLQFFSTFLSESAHNGNFYDRHWANGKCPASFHGLIKWIRLIYRNRLVALNYSISHHSDRSWCQPALCNHMGDWCISHRTENHSYTWRDDLRNDLFYSQAELRKHKRDISGRKFTVLHFSPAKMCKVDKICKICKTTDQWEVQRNENFPGSYIFEFVIPYSNYQK